MRKLLLAAMIGLVTACGTTSQGTPLPGEIDIRKLDVGPYPTEPPNAHDDDYVPAFWVMRDAAAMRLIDYIASPYDIDPRMKFGWLTSHFTAGSLTEEFGPSAVAEDIARRNNLLFGVRVNGGDAATTVPAAQWGSKAEPNSTTAAIAVTQFAATEGARQAADEFYRAQLDAYGARNVPITIPKYPDAHAHWQPGVPFAWAMLAHGPYLVTLYLSVPTADADALTALAQKFFDTQLPLLDRLPPVSDEGMLRLPWDPDHLVARTLNPDKIEGPSFVNGRKTFGERGVLAFAADREFVHNRLTAMDADKFAMIDRTMVARTANAETARRVVADRITLTRGADAAASPPNLPGATCIENKSINRFDPFGRRFNCLVAYRRYVGIVAADQLLDAHQRAAAQYALFANSGD
ncbi:DUF7373 family lipoprotein [Nocardia panacis]|nr:hypothetical protein [Nocardia panacis]